MPLNGRCCRMKILQNEFVQISKYISKLQVMIPKYGVTIYSWSSPIFVKRLIKICYILKGYNKMETTSKDLSMMMVII